MHLSNVLHRKYHKNNYKKCTYLYLGIIILLSIIKVNK